MGKITAAFLEVDVPPTEPEHDWARVELSGICADMRSGIWQPTVPTILPVDGAAPLFYAGRINQVFGESGSGKTWVALAAVCCVIRNGGRAMVVDYEDVASGLVERLINLGVTDDELARVDYRHPSSGILRGVDYLNATTDPYDLIVFDSTGEAMAAGSVKANDDAEVAGWFTLLKQFIELPGAPAIVVIDHVPKSKDAPPLYAISSQRKRAAITGAGYRVDVITPFAKGRPGKIKLTVAKDRLGNRPMSDVACEVDVLCADNDGVELRFHLSSYQTAMANGQPFRPTNLMEKVSRWLEYNAGSSRRQTRDAIHGNAKAIETAISVLVDEGHLAVADGPNKAQLLTVARRYRADDELSVMPAVVMNQTPAPGDQYNVF